MFTQFKAHSAMSSSLASHNGLTANVSKPYSGDIQAHTLDILSQAKRYHHWIFNQFKPFLGASVLEVGCGIGTYTQLILDLPGVETVTALETMAPYVAQLNEAVLIPTGKTLDARCQNFLESTENLASFDSCILLNVLEHIEHEDQALRLLRDLLNPDGRLLLLVPALPGLLSPYDRSIGHFRRYTKDSLGDSLKKQGFHVESLYYFNALATLGWWFRFCLLQKKQFEPRSVNLFEMLVPVCQWIESTCRPPLGLSLVAVAKKL